MTEQEERYVHFSCCLEWLNESWNLLQLLKNDRDNLLRASAFRFALVLYAKPYRDSRGQSRRYRLDTSLVPSEYLDLHSQIVQQRDQLHAHSDLTVLDAKLTVHRFVHRKQAQTISNYVDPTALLVRLDEVIDLVETTLDRMYSQSSKLESLLPTTT